MNKVTLLRSIAVIAVFCVAAVSLFKSSDEKQAVHLSEVNATTSLASSGLDTTMAKVASSTSKPAIVSSKKQPTRTNPIVTPEPQVTTVYKNGQYQTVTTYRSPGGIDQLGVSLTLENDQVTDASVTNMASSGTSRRYEDVFINSYRDYVVGKKLSDLNLDRVSGASLTTEAFNSAVAQIKAKAQS